MSWFFDYRCNRSLKNHLCRLQYWIFDFAAYMQHYAKNTVSALNHSIILFILWKFVKLCIFGRLIQPEQVSLKKCSISTVFYGSTVYDIVCIKCAENWGRGVFLHAECNQMGWSSQKMLIWRLILYFYSILTLFTISDVSFFIWLIFMLNFLYRHNLLLEDHLHRLQY